MKGLSGKTVLLTVASTGIGPVIARRLRLAGARFVLSARNQAALTKLADELGDSRIVVADLSRAGEPERLAGEAGAVDLPFFKARGPARGPPASLPPPEGDPAPPLHPPPGALTAHQRSPPRI